MDADEPPEAAELPPIRFGKVGAGGASHSPNFKEAIRPPPGIMRSDFVVPDWATEQLDAHVAVFKAATGSTATKAKNAAIADAVHVLAAVAVNELGIQPAKAVSGIYPELGNRMASKMPYAEVAGGDALCYAKKIQTRGNSFKRGGLYGRKGAHCWCSVTHHPHAHDGCVRLLMFARVPDCCACV